MADSAYPYDHRNCGLAQAAMASLPALKHTVTAEETTAEAVSSNRARAATAKCHSARIPVETAQKYRAENPQVKAEQASQSRDRCPDQKWRFQPVKESSCEMFPTHPYSCRL